MVDQAATGHSFSLAFCHMEQENDNGYIWSLQELKILFQPPIIPKVITTDCEPALKMAIELVFPSSIHNYCTWNIIKALSKIVANIFKRMIGRIIGHPGTYWSVPSQLRNIITILKKSNRSQNITQDHGHISQTAYSHSRKHLSLLGKASSHVESAHSYIK
ncbi:hypothetical protein O181_092462 [Austropuccinia psidii MF-1]|uniref:MULE transposase domain-containing protein n=1 Tax=Austropuccinia psidii MF-1 TaxID=1389203 RepID=A0A9Q3IZ66_9BASI|nr:hypothetical protein [Austropuccinia psidii MF-1]